MKGKTSLYLKITAVLLSIFAILGLLRTAVILIQYSKVRPELFWKILMITLPVGFIPLVVIILAIGLWRGNEKAVIITPIFSCIPLFLIFKFGFKDAFSLMEWVFFIGILATICLPLVHMALPKR